MSTEPQAPAAGNAPTPDPLIRIRGLSTVLNGKTIFDKIDLDIPRGKITAVMGPSGTGKTTLMRHITGQLAPDAGEVIVDGQNVVKLDRAALFALREKIGYLFQNSALLTDYSVFENVAFPLRQHLDLPEVLVRDPMLIIYDEPFVGLDPIALNQILKLIRTLNDTLGVTSILVAHELAAIRQVADSIFLLAGGKIAAHGAPDELAKGETPWTKQS